MKTNTRLSRRAFARQLALAGVGAPLVLRSGLLSAAPNSKLNHACIGVGGMMGFNDVQSFKSHPQVQIVALCDVDQQHLAKGLGAVPDARQYADWRELLAQEKDKIDSVNVTVPDHMHYAIALRALQAGKNVYCQKPLCHDVAEVRALTQAAAKAKVHTQLGTQHSSGTGGLSLIQLLQDGAIGKAKHVYLCSNRPNAIDKYRLVGPRPAQAAAAPATLNWPLWLGTAPERSFAPDVYHPVKWRAWQDFGTGWSGDIGCHVFDPVWKGLGLANCKSVVAEVQDSWKASAERRVDTWPQSDHITWVFPGNERTEGKELVVEWFDGLMYIPEEFRRLYSADLKEYPPESALVLGTEGAVVMELGHSPILLPEPKFKDFKLPPVPKRNHYHHFVDACLGGEKTASNFPAIGAMAEAIILGTVAVRVPDQKLEWDAGKMKFPNCPDAEKYLRRTYRTGWEVPL